MNLRLPDRWGRFQGIEGLPLILVASQAMVYIAELLSPGLASLLVLSPWDLRAGDWWRPLTFLFVPPTRSVIFLFFWLYLFYVYAAALETEWGTFRFTIFYLTGALATAAVGLYPAPGVVPNVYLNACLFLAFATLFGDYEILLFFVLPTKVRYIGYVTWAWMVLAFLRGTVLDRLAILAALLAFFLLLGPHLWDRLALRLQVVRQQRRWNKMNLRT
jgi:membrane associated rhomboid family serine protease